MIDRPVVAHKVPARLIELSSPLCYSTASKVWRAALEPSANVTKAPHPPNAQAYVVLVNTLPHVLTIAPRIRESGVGTHQPGTQRGATSTLFAVHICTFLHIEPPVPGSLRKSAINISW